jgi:hypothetical protein
MNKGTKVRLIDGSYSMKVENGEIKDTGNIVSGCTYEVVDTGLKLPTRYYSTSPHDHWNDTILKNTKTGELVFVEARFIREITQPVAVPFLEAVKAYSEGKTIRCEMSGMEIQRYTPNRYGSYKCLKSQLGATISANEILNGKWYIGEPNE